MNKRIDGSRQMYRLFEKISINIDRYASMYKLIPYLQLSNGRTDSGQSTQSVGINNPPHSLTYQWVYRQQQNEVCEVDSGQSSKRCLRPLSHIFTLFRFVPRNLRCCCGSTWPAIRGRHLLSVGRLTNYWAICSWLLPNCNCNCNYKLAKSQKAATCKMAINVIRKPQQLKIKVARMEANFELRKVQIYRSNLSLLKCIINRQMYVESCG